MRFCFALTVSVVFLATCPSFGQETPAKSKTDDLAPPGTRGNADNVPFIGKSDPNRNPVRLAKASGHVSNYNEEKVASYTLPDPLVMSSGERVTSAALWRERRRPEILKFYETEIYGRIPDYAPQVT